MDSGRKTYWNNKKYYFAKNPPLSAGARIWPNALFGDDPLEVGSSLCHELTLALHLFPRVHSDSYYAHLIAFSAVLCSGAILSSSIEGALYKSS